MTTTGLTIDDFEKLPDELAYNHELVDGKLVDVSGNTSWHNLLRDTFLVLMQPHPRQHKLGLIICAGFCIRRERARTGC